MRIERRGLRAIALAAFGTAAVADLTGCIALPLPDHRLLSGKGAVPEETIEAMRADHATRADVLLRLGEPSERRENDRVFVYGWQTCWGYMLMFGAGGVALRKEKYAAIRFDDQACVADVFLATPRVFHSFRDGVVTPARGVLEEWVARDAPQASAAPDTPDAGAR